MPYFTLATITKNNLNGLRQTWDSIQSQQCTDFEWLVQDGASKDGSIDFLNTTPAITDSQADSGIYDAMNRLINRAKGEYIIFLNAGDQLASADILSQIAKCLAGKKPPIDLPDLIYGDALEDNHYKTAKPHTTIAHGLFTHHQAIIYRRACIQDLRYDTAYKIAADYDFTARFLAQHNNALYISTPICIFETGGLSQQSPTLGRREQYQIRKCLNLCAPLTNRMITIRQATASALRAIAPRLYWLLKPAKP